MANRLGPIQVFIMQEAKELAAWYQANGSDPARAGVTVPQLYEKCGGRYFGPELFRSAEALVRRGLLVKNKVGYGLPSEEAQSK